MKRPNNVASSVIGVLLVLPSAAHAESDEAKIQRAKALFERYVQLGQSYDPLVADLYAGGATIRNTRRYPDGQVRTLRIPVDQYRTLIREAMPLARARGDADEFSDVTFTVESGGVRIKCTRYSKLKGYPSPFELLVGPTLGNDWLVTEEISESRP